MQPTMIMFKFKLNKIRRIHVTMGVENNLFANNHIPVQIMRDPKHNLPSFFLNFNTVERKKT